MEGTNDQQRRDRSPAASPQKPQQGQQRPVSSRQLSRPRLQKSASEQVPSSSELLMWMNSNSKFISSSPRRPRTSSDYENLTDTYITAAPARQYPRRPSQRSPPSDYQAIRQPPPPRTADDLPIGPQRSKSSRTMTRMVVDDEEEAEGQVIRELEDRRRRAMTTDGMIRADGWSSAVEGEQPPLGRELPFSSVYNVYHDDDIEQQRRSNTHSSTMGHSRPPPAPRRLADVANKVRQALKSGLLSPSQSSSNRKVMASPRLSREKLERGSSQETEKEAASSNTPPPPPPPPPALPALYHTEPPVSEVTALAPEQLRRELNTPAFDRVMMNSGNNNNNRARALTTDADRMVSGVLAIEQVFLDEGLTDDDDDYLSSTGTSVDSQKNEINEEMQPLNASSPLLPSFVKDNNSRATLDRKRAAAKKRKSKLRACKVRWRRRFRNFFRRIGLFTQPSWSGFFHVLLHSLTISVGIPSFIAAIILYYTLGPISLDFLPGDANMIWWLAFLARQCVTLDLARMAQWFLVDCVALKSRLAVLYLGPLVTLWAIQSHGWPFLCTSWSLFNMVLLMGRNQFQLDWVFLVWEPPGLTNAMLDPQGKILLGSDFYFRLLLAMLVAGVATSAKRTSVAMYFGRKTLLNYRSRLEKLLSDMAIIEEIAQLAYEANTVAAEIAAAAAMIDDEAAAPFDVMKNSLMKRSISAASDGKWHSMTLNSGDRSRPPKLMEDPQDDSDASVGPVMVSATKATTGIAMPIPEMNPSTDSERKGMVGMKSQEEMSFDMSASDDFSQGLSVDDDDEEDYADDEGDQDEDDSPVAADKPSRGHRPRSMGASTASMSTNRIKNLLDRWEEPVNKQDRSMDASIHDILKFRKALTYMDEAFPFSVSFGPASTRDECIKSSQRIYRRLLKLSSVRGILSFDVLKVLSLDGDGVENEAKTRLIKRLFRPDLHDLLPLIAFVQSCDVVYKRLRYFRASVGNSSVIDKVLQDIIDVIYYFALALVILSMLKFNPWPLLVSISTLLVSCAFAVGTSTSKIVEGILLIAARRPYDLGDRVVINPSEDVVNHGVSFSWIVEDINLFTTTIRFGQTNEVATVSNGSIAQSRIVNCQRSHNAIVTLELQFSLEATNELMEEFASIVEQYIRERPRTWDSMANFRCDVMDTGLMMKSYTLQVRHTKTWQDSPHILLSRSELLKFCIETGDKMKINYEVYHTQINYDGGRWEGFKARSQRNLMMQDMQDSSPTSGTGADI